MPNQETYPDLWRSQDFKTLFSLKISKRSSSTVIIFWLCAYVFACVIQWGPAVPNNVSSWLWFRKNTPFTGLLCVRSDPNQLSASTVLFFLFHNEKKKHILLTNTLGRKLEAFQCVLKQENCYVINRKGFFNNLCFDLNTNVISQTIYRY